MNLDATKRQMAVFRIIERQCSLGEPAPTLREIGHELGMPNVSAVAKHVQALRRKGMLHALDGKSRSLRVISPLRSLQSAVAHIPIFGSIPAGLAERHEQEAEGCVTVDIETIGYKPTKNAFALRVTGDSMMGRHILDGDYVILEHGPEPRNGQIVAALIDGESTLKTYLLKGGKPYLRAENPKYPNLIPAQELMIQGVFKALIRKARE
jgi:repressor LexA